MSNGERAVLLALQDIERSLPFPLLGFDCDNGSEFLNWFILQYFTHRTHPVHYTRSRPYHKNDNAHIEEKNWTFVRQYLGYQRLAQPCLADQLNELYTSVLSPITIKKLHTVYSSLNPFGLQQQVSKKIKAILAHADPLPRYVANDLLAS